MFARATSKAAHAFTAFGLTTTLSSVDMIVLRFCCQEPYLIPFLVATNFSSFYDHITGRKSQRTFTRGQAFPIEKEKKLNRPPSQSTSDCGPNPYAPKAAERKWPPHSFVKMFFCAAIA